MSRSGISSPRNIFYNRGFRSSSSMHHLHWRPAVAADLRAPSAPRVITKPILRALVSAYRPKVALQTVRSMIQELLEAEAIRPAWQNTGVYLNLSSEPKVSWTEAAPYLLEGAMASLETVLAPAGVVTFAGANLTCVAPWRGRIRSESPYFPFTKPGGPRVDFYLLPESNFSPAGQDDGDVLDNTKSYPCATPERAFLDWLWVEECVRGFEPQAVHADLSGLDETRLVRLAAKTGLSWYLERFLKKSLASRVSQR